MLDLIRKLKLFRAICLGPIFLVPVTELRSQNDASTGGTCAVFLQNGKNLAFAIDSAVTSTMNGVRTNRKELACKIWLPTPSIMVATTGLLETGPFLTGWNALSSGRAWTRSLPPDPTEQQIDEAIRGWGSHLMSYLSVHPMRHDDGEIASIIVIFRSSGRSFAYKERIVEHEGKVMRDDGQSVRWILSDNESARLYSGSCRNFVKVGGQRAVQLTPSESVSLGDLGNMSRSTQIDSAVQLGELALRFEHLFTELTKSHATDPGAGDDVGPPFQLAILPVGSEKWTTTFSGPCDSSSLSDTH